MEHSVLFMQYINDFKAIPAYNESLLTIPDASEDILKKLFSCIDITSLNTVDCSNSIEDFCEKVVSLQSLYPNMPNVAAICVYPVFASILKSKLRNSEIKSAVVSAGFPASQTFLDTKIEETKRAIFFGANEIDIVLSVGEFLEGNYDFCGNEIAEIKAVMGDAHLKVIIESGALPNNEEIWKASILAMEAGADFIKTSTGKLSPAATPEAAWIMAHAIKAYSNKRNRKIGFKAAGGIVNIEDAILYYAIQEKVLGQLATSNDLFRIGASRLANNILTAVAKFSEGKDEVKYF